MGGRSGPGRFAETMLYAQWAGVLPWMSRPALPVAAGAYGSVDAFLSVFFPAPSRESRLLCLALAFDQDQMTVHPGGWKDLLLAAEPIDLDAIDLGARSQTEIQA